MQLRIEAEGEGEGEAEKVGGWIGGSFVANYKTEASPHD